MIDKEIERMLRKGIRIDGRKPLEYRDIEFKQGIILTSEGSAWVKAGKMEILAGVKLNIMEPFPDTPDEGSLMVDSELIPLSNPRFSGGPPDIETIEIARVIDRGIREGEAIDKKALVIKEGEKVWNVSIDVIPLNYDGNPIDVGGIAALLALMNTRFPKVDDDGNINYKELSNKKLPIKHYPLPITVFKVGNSFFVDPIEEEEKVIDARLTITLLENGDLCALQKGGKGSLTKKDIEKMVDIALEKNKELRKKVFKHIEG